MVSGLIMTIGLIGLTVFNGLATFSTHVRIYNGLYWMTLLGMVSIFLMVPR